MSVLEDRRREAAERARTHQSAGTQRTPFGIAREVGRCPDCQPLLNRGQTRIGHPIPGTSYVPVTGKLGLEGIYRIHAAKHRNGGRAG